jgi:glycosyltransferase involved in cell wall biosynthesis
MKILMLLETEFPPDVRVENEIAALLEAGHEVHLACATRKNRPAEEMFGSAFIHRKNISSLVYRSSVGALKFPLYFNFWRKYISGLMLKEKFDAVHVHDLPLSIVGAEIKKKYRIPLIIDLHENWPGLLSISSHTRTIVGRLLCNIEQWKLYEKKYLLLADRVIVVVDEAAERLMKLSVPEKNLVVVSNTLNISGFPEPLAREKRSSEKKILIYEGGLTYHRGVQYVLQALSGVRHLADRIEFRIVGAGNYLEELKSLSEKLQLNDMVRFLGWQPQKNVYEEIGKADLAIIPHIKSSHTDSTIPHKLFHYMYAGLPILVSNCDPLGRIIKETSTGYVYQFDDFDELAGKIESLLITGSPLRPENGKEWVERKYNWDVDKKRLISAYKELEQ